MNYAIYSYVLMSGGVPEITWEVPSGQNVPWVVLSVRGCLLWGIHNGGHFMGLCVCVMHRVVMICDGGIYIPILIVAKMLANSKKIIFVCNKGNIFWNSSTNKKRFCYDRRNCFLCELLPFLCMWG